MADKLFTKDFIRMFFSNALMCSGFYMLMPLLPVYAVQELGMEQGKVGIVIGVFAISAVIARPLAGVLLDNFGRMIIYIPAAIMFGFCFGAYILAGAAFSLLLVRVIHGFSWGMVSTSNSTIVSDIVPANMRGQGMGYFGLSMNLAMALGPAFGVFLLNFTSTNAIFILCMVLVFVALLSSSWVRPPVIIKRGNKPFSIKSLFERRVAGIALMQFFFGFVYSSVMSYSTLHGLELKVKGLGLFFIVLAVFLSILRPYAGKLLDKTGPKMLLTIGFIFFGAGAVQLGMSTTSIMFLSSAVPLGLGAGFIMPTIVAMAINVVPASRRGTANATVFTAFDVGIGTGAIVLGAVAQYGGFRWMYIVAALILLIPLLWFRIFELKRYLRYFAEMRNGD